MKTFISLPEDITITPMIIKDYAGKYIGFVIKDKDYEISTRLNIGTELEKRICRSCDLNTNFINKSTILVNLLYSEYTESLTELIKIIKKYGIDFTNYTVKEETHSKVYKINIYQALYTISIYNCYNYSNYKNNVYLQIFSGNYYKRYKIKDKYSLFNAKIFGSIFCLDTHFRDCLTNLSTVSLRELTKEIKSIELPSRILIKNTQDLKTKDLKEIKDMHDLLKRFNNLLSRLYNKITEFVRECDADNSYCSLTNKTYGASRCKLLHLPIEELGKRIKRDNEFVNKYLDNESRIIYRKNCLFNLGIFVNIPKHNIDELQFIVLNCINKRGKTRFYRNLLGNSNEYGVICWGDVNIYKEILKESNKDFSYIDLGKVLNMYLSSVFTIDYSPYEVIYRDKTGEYLNLSLNLSQHNKDDEEFLNQQFSVSLDLGKDLRNLSYESEGYKLKAFSIDSEKGFINRIYKQNNTGRIIEDPSIFLARRTDL